jgi:hypothetical protein
MPSDSTALDTILAECQAREKVLRDGLLDIDDWDSATLSASGMARLLDLPSDSTALDTLLKAAELKGRRGLLNRLHKVADTIGKNTTSQEARDSIRNLAKELE